MADGGTLLLDEISEISPGLQAKLLRVIQEREIERVGGGKPIPVDVRIISTTNRELSKEIEEGRFREDLFYRLNVVPLYLPTIAERREDIPLLVRHFVLKYSKDNGIPIKGVSEKAMKMLTQRDWPGNVREIENCIERAVVMCSPDSDVLDVNHFFLQDRSVASAVPAHNSSMPMTLREVEKSLILSTLEKEKNNRTKTAEILGISVRTLRNKLNEYRMEGIPV
jgi:transcriptional regulator with PAS, ATPase and Fis domain